MADLPSTPPDEDEFDACCGKCSSLFHSTEDHPTGPLTAALAGKNDSDFPPGYDPAEADRLIGRDPQAQ